ncbi:MAG: hypothetical protein J5J00_10850 [Deltaproteobacteria bacterium]|nr:hypothetical protein [Deltaproteobacteria bacterium]
MTIKKLLLIPLAAAALFFVTPVSADPHCRACPYDCSDLGLGKKDCSFVSNARGICCVDLTKKGMAIALAQERALGSSGHAPAPAAQNNHRCPPGFQQSEQKCSQKERKHGCKDIRLPNGIGCVKR